MAKTTGCDPQSPGRDHPSAAISTAVPEVQLVSIVHPCIVNDFDTGFHALGGEQQVQHILDDDSDDDHARKRAWRGASTPVVGVSLRPHDPLAKKLESSPTVTQNLLIKLTVPKWTGRKRKRASDDLFMPAINDKPRHSTSAPHLIRRLQDNAGNYTVQAIGKVETTHRFDHLPDLHIHDRDVPIMRELRQHATTPKYDLLKDFHIDLTPGAAGISALPRPPHFLPHHLERGEPFEPRPNAPPQSEEKLTATSQDTVQPKQTSGFRHTPGDQIPENLKLAIETLDNYLVKRPIVGRAALLKILPVPPYKIDKALTYVGWKPKCGPWRDCSVKAGVDPTSDPQYRFYQVIQARPPKHHLRNAIDSHIFDGTAITHQATFQLCDLTDPVLATVVNTPHFRTKEEGYGGTLMGWYHNGTLAKIRMLLLDKFKRLAPGGVPLDQRAYMAIAALPDKVEEGTAFELDAAVWGAEARALSLSIRKEAFRMASATRMGYGSGMTRIARGDGDGHDDGDGDGDEGGEMADLGMIDPMLMDRSTSGEAGTDQGEGTSRSPGPTPASGAETSPSELVNLRVGERENEQEDLDDHYS